MPKVEQPEYSMLKREPLEGQILPLAAPRGIGLVVWSPLAMGMLTGKYDDGIPADQAYEQKLRETNSVPAAQNACYDRTTWVIRDHFGWSGKRAVIAGELTD